MFVGESGVILTSGFHVRSPYVLEGDMKLAAEISTGDPAERTRGEVRFIKGIKEEKQIAGSFREAWPITEAVNLYGAALRANKALKYDGEKQQVTNDATADGYLDRSYRQGWEIDKI